MGKLRTIQHAVIAVCFLTIGLSLQEKASGTVIVAVSTGAIVNALHLLSPNNWKVEHA